MKLGVELVGARMRAPVVSAHGEVGLRSLLLVRLAGADGAVGCGEAAPLESYDGVSIDDVRAALEDCRKALSESDGAEHETLLSECARAAVLPQAVAAIDLALWDLAGRRADEPVWRLLGARTSPDVEVNATIGAVDRAGAAREVAVALAAGFRCVKV